MELEWYLKGIKVREVEVEDESVLEVVGNERVDGSMESEVETTMLASLRALWFSNNKISSEEGFRCCLATLYCFRFHAKGPGPR